MERPSGVALAPPIAELSGAQARLWDLETHLGTGSAHVFALAYELEGKLNLRTLDRALSQVAQMHQALRVRVEVRDGSPCFVAASPRGLERLIATADQKKGSEGYARLLRAEATRQVDPRRGAGWRAVVIEHSDDEFTLLLQFHHLIADRASVGVFISDLALAYRAAAGGQSFDASPRGAAMSARAPQGPEAEALAAFWQSLFVTAPPALMIPGALPIANYQNYDGERIEARLDRNVLRPLELLADTEQLSLFVVLLSAFAATLYAHTQQRDLAICTPMAGRHRAGTRKAIGYFNNIVPLRLDLRGDPPFTELVARVARPVREAFANQDLPFHEIAGLPELAGSRLTHCLFALQNIPGLRLDLPDIRSRYFDVPNGTANFDVALFLEKMDGELVLLLDHKTGVVPAPAAARIQERFFELLRLFAVDPALRLSHLPRFAVTQTLPESVATSVPPSQRYTRDTELERRIVEIWRDVFRSGKGGDELDITAESHFFRMGGDSIRAARMFQRIAEQFGHQLPLATLLEAPSPRQIAERLANEEWVAPWLSLLPVKTSGSRPPVFCIQGGGGNVLQFGYLSERLDADQPMYCLQPYGLERGALSTVEEMAVHYLPAVRQLSPAGPYKLAGASLGGAVAYEMAQRLVAEGETVTFVGLIDYAGPGIHLSVADKLRDHAMYLRTLPWRGRVDYVKRRLKRRFGARSIEQRDAAHEQTEQANAAILESSVRALQRYVVRPYSGRIALFRALQGSRHVLTDPQGGWGGLTAGVDIFDVSGDHITITHPPHVLGLADAFARALDQSDAGAGHAPATTAAS